ncbi:hypothetical protein C8R44DRAFT_727262 [Mycena epipterygia]|nr:hypothetical protein C8R44DRAFT_727262 [Mycena epipterygia]
MASDAEKRDTVKGENLRLLRDHFHVSENSAGHRNLESTRANARERMAKLRENQSSEEIRAAAEKRRARDADYQEYLRRKFVFMLFLKNTWIDCPLQEIRGEIWVCSVHGDLFPFVRVAWHAPLARRVFPVGGRVGSEAEEEAGKKGPEIRPRWKFLDRGPVGQ